jgi:hypothetical protein
MRTASETLVHEAAKKLEAYLKTGIDGLRQQAYDRLEAAGINTRGVSKDVQGARHLIDHLWLNGWR